MIVIRGDHGCSLLEATRAVPQECAAVVLRKDEAELAQFGLQSCQPIRLLDAQALQAVEAEGKAKCSTRHDERLRHIGDQHTVARKARGQAEVGASV